MTHKLQPVRGTKDIFGKDMELFNHVIEVSREISLNYGFREISVPVFEFSEVYERNLGESSDVISKEVYKFPDRSGNSLTLRPEFTAGVIRAFINNGEMARNLPQKFFSHGSVFRYDRPQKGRWRQFHQINCELIGSDHIISDIEIISLAARILDDLGILNHVSLHINSLGCETTRAKYQDALVGYFSKYESDLSDDSKRRLTENPLRILDSKDRGDRRLIEGMDIDIADYYQPQVREDFESILGWLDDLGIAYKTDGHLVRGLDYYTSTVFEFVSRSEHSGAQNTILAGGRYNGLIQKMSSGGASLDIPAIGFAAGIERLMMLSNIQLSPISPISIIPVQPQQEGEAFRLADSLRRSGFYIEMSYSGNIKKRMKKADALQSRLAVIIGEDEIREGTYKIRNFSTGEEQSISQNKITEYLLECEKEWL